MELYQNLCKNCGGDLHANADGRYKCAFCGSFFEEKAVIDYAYEMRQLFDEMKLEAISNARRNLYEAVSAEYISNTLVHECAMTLKQLIPDDFQANFYEIAIGNNPRRIAKSIRRLDVAENASIVDTMVRFLILSLQSEFVTEVSDLIERAYKGSDLTKYEKFSTMLSEEAEKIDNCIYMTSYPRDVFVAYSSKDMEKVLELVECLEEQGFSCFVAARNLRHGRGAVENYDKALREAMDNCTSFVFVSSTHSRHPGCDALKREIPYVKSVDIENAPAELRQDYAGIPHKYKKHRVEYRIEESIRPMAADRIVSEFFAGYERVYSPDEVADRLMNRPTVFDDETDAAVEQKKTKFCIACLSECDDGAEVCPACGGAKFASTRMEAELMKELVDSRKRTAAPEAPAASGAPATNVNSLLKRAFMFLEDGKWSDADDYCEKVLDIDPENAEAYLGKLMAELQVKSRKTLADCEKPFDNKDNYKKVLRFGGAELKAELSGYIKHIKDRNEQARQKAEEERLGGLYNQAKNKMNTSESEEDYKMASSMFILVKDYKDSALLSEKCLKLAEEARLEVLYQEAMRALNEAKNENDYQNASVLFASIKDYKDSAELSKKCIVLAGKARIDRKYQIAKQAMDTASSEEDYKKASNLFAAVKDYNDSIELSQKCLVLADEARQKEEKEKKDKTIGLISFLSIAVILIAFLIVLITVIIPNNKYNDAIELMEDGKYSEAIIAFEILNDYKDSAEKIEECQTAIIDSFYGEALALMTEGKYTEAIAKFESLNGYKDSAEKIEECSLKIQEDKYSSAVSLLEDGYFTEALEIFESKNWQTTKTLPI